MINISTYMVVLCTDTKRDCQCHISHSDKVIFFARRLVNVMLGKVRLA